jgi:hypothetical protein
MLLATNADEAARYRMTDPYSAAGREAAKTARAPKVLAVVLACVIACVCACVVAVDYLRAPAIDAYASQEITVTGLLDEPFTITAADLLELDCVNMTVSGQGKATDSGADNTKTVSAYGPTLATFLAAYDEEPENFGRIIFNCKDDYSVVLKDSQLTQQVIMSISNDKDALEEYQQPLRLVIPSEESGNWAYGVVSIDFNR